MGSEVLTKNRQHAFPLHDTRAPSAPSAAICRRSSFPDICDRRIPVFIFVLAVTSPTACLRLTPSERPASDTESSDDNPHSSDTPYQDTSTLPETCDGVLCHERPDAGSCSEGIITIVSGDGYCARDTDGAPECRFDTEKVICPTGKCADAKRCEGLPCHGVRCDRPEPSECVGGNDGGSSGEQGSTLIVYEREGRCEPGETDGESSCRHDIATSIECTGGCVTDPALGARCQDEPCLGVVCNQPPARFCQDADTLVVWNLFGRCAGDDGSCVYNKRTIDCSAKGGCQNGRCVHIPCEGIICQRPLARYCSSRNTVVDFDPVGTCDEVGACVYREAQRPCPSSDCQGGNCGSQACLTSSSCHTPPAPYCNAEDELVFWNATTDCTSGHCRYRTQKEPCALGWCKDGRCTGDPCEGPTWPCMNGAPAAYCADETHRMVSSGRECSKQGGCDYKTEPEPCPGRCRAGVCE